MGKTSDVYGAFTTLKRKQLAKGMLVFAPLRPVYSVWPAERDKWTDFHHLSVGILHGSDKIMERVLHEDHDVYVINYEGIPWLFGRPEPNWKKVDPAIVAQLRAEFKVERARVNARLKRLFEVVDIAVFDELSKLSDLTTQRAKSLKPHLHRFARRWGLTGSPAANGLMKLFGQAYVLDLGKAFGPYITHFRNQFFHPSGFGGFDWELNHGADEQIYARVKPLMLRLERDNLPPLVPVPITVDLPPDARKVYDEMENELFATVGERGFLAKNAAVASMKCMQIASGALYHDNVDPETGLPVRGPRKWAPIHDVKLSALRDLTEELQGQPLLCGYWFGHELERILKSFGKGTPHGNVPPKQFEALRQRWNRNELPYLFGHPASIGHGLNLQEGSAAHVAFLTTPWDYELWDQFVRRVRRTGTQASRIFVYYFVARDTVDEDVQVALRRKGRVQGALFEALKTSPRRHR